MDAASPFAPEWPNYEFFPSFVLGFHGCDSTTGEAILPGKLQHLSPSENAYDWLGNGIYFWEGSPARARQFAHASAAGGRGSRGNIRRPFVLGAIIDLKRCMNLADSDAIARVEQAYATLAALINIGDDTLPSNSLDLKRRYLDCAVFNALHDYREAAQLPSYDSVRGLFWEGSEIYPGAGLREFNHIQICVRNTDCILGYFRPLQP